MTWKKLSARFRRHVSVMHFNKIRGRKILCRHMRLHNTVLRLLTNRQTRFPNNHRYLQIHNTEDGDENVEVFTKTWGRVFPTAEGIMTGKIGHFLYFSFKLQFGLLKFLFTLKSLFFVTFWLDFHFIISSVLFTYLILWWCNIFTLIYIELITLPALIGWVNLLWHL